MIQSRHVANGLLVGGLSVLFRLATVFMESTGMNAIPIDWDREIRQAAINFAGGLLGGILYSVQIADVPSPGIWTRARAGALAGAAVGLAGLVIHVVFGTLWAFPSPLVAALVVLVAPAVLGVLLAAMAPHFLRRTAA